MAATSITTEKETLMNGKKAKTLRKQAGFRPSDDREYTHTPVYSSSPGSARVKGNLASTVVTTLSGMVGQARVAYQKSKAA